MQHEIKVVREAQVRLKENYSFVSLKEDELMQLLKDLSKAYDELTGHYCFVSFERG